MQYVDPRDWPHYEISEFFAGLDWPFYSVTFRADATALYARAKAGGYSFYFAACYAAAKAAGRVDAFLYKLRQDGVVKHDALAPSFTVPAENDLFRIVTMDVLPGETEAAFAVRARNVAAMQTTLVADMENERRDDLLYLSCLPWLDFTSLTNERSFDKNDSIPRIAWGKLTEHDGARTMPVSIDVNHRLIDGRHIGQFSEAFQRALDGRED